MLFGLGCLPTEEQEQQVQPRLAGHGRDRHHRHDHLQPERRHRERLISKNATENDVIIKKIENLHFRKKIRKFIG